jgi:hypothetical protein
MDLALGNINEKAHMHVPMLINWGWWYVSMTVLVVSRGRRMLILMIFLFQE